MVLDIIANPIVATVGIILAIVALLVIVANRYVTITPNLALIVSGRRGTRVVTGGGTLVLPVVEAARTISLELMTVDLAKKNVYTKTGVPVNLTGVVQFRVGDGSEAILTAAKAMLGQTREQIQARLEETLDGHLRAICGSMTPTDLVTDRDAFAQQVVSAAADDLAKMGFIINSLTVKDLSDDVGYYTAWGTPEVQKVLRDAKIATAEADRDARQKAALATQVAVQQEQDSEAKKAEFQKDTQLKVAAFKQETETKKAIADKANAIESAKQEQKLKEEAMKVSIVEKLKMAEVTELQKKVRENEGEAEKIYRIKVAEAAAIELENQGKGAGLEVRSRQEGEAEGRKRVLEATAAGNKATLLAEAEGNQATLLAEAAGSKAKLLAEAEGNQAKLLAEAAGTKAQMLAEAEGIRAKALAEAEGTLKRAAALKELNQTGLELERLKIIPKIVEAFGPVVSAAGEGMGKVGNVTVIQQGDSKEAPTGPITKGVLDLMTLAPPILKAYGIDISKLMSGDKTELDKLGRFDQDTQRDTRKSSGGKKTNGDEGGSPPSAPAAAKTDYKEKRFKEDSPTGYKPKVDEKKWDPETQSELKESTQPWEYQSEYATKVKEEVKAKVQEKAAEVAGEAVDKAVDAAVKLAADKEEALKQRIREVARARCLRGSEDACGVHT